MPRRKYKFKTRAEAEEAFQKADRQRLLTEWVFSAFIAKNHHTCGRVKFNDARIEVGYVGVRHTIIVYAVNRFPEFMPHRVIGIWGADDQDLQNTIAGTSKHTDTYPLSDLLNRARCEALEWARITHSKEAVG